MKFRSIAAAALLFAAAGYVQAEKPKRIISLAPSVTKSLYLLGEEDKIAAITVYCPQGSGAKERIGTVLEPNLEKIISLSPDLVIASKEGNRPQTVEKLKSLGVNVYVMGSLNSFPDICDDFLALARIVGQEAKAKGIIENAKNKIRGIQDKVGKRAKVRVFWEVGAQPLFTASRNSFVNDFIELAGGTNIFGELETRYPQISREEVIRRDPDAIVMVTMGDVTSNEKASWEKFKELRAVKTKRIYVLDNSIFTDPTPTAVADGVEIISAILHGNSDVK